MQVSFLERHSRVVSAALAILFTCSAVCVNAGVAFAAGSGILWQKMPLGSRPPGARYSHRLGPQVMTRSFLSTGVLGKPVIFSTLASENVIDIFLQASPNKMVGQISDSSLNGPSEIATDLSGNLYVSNSNTDTVTVYSPPYINGPRRVIQEPGYIPGPLALSSNGILAVANYCEALNCPDYVVSFYARGATTPCKIIPLSEFAVAEGISFDDAGNAFVGGQNNSGNTQLPYIAEIKGGCEAKTAESLTASNNLVEVYDIHVNKQDQVALIGLIPGNAANTYTENIYTYNLPVYGSLGKPVYTTPVPYGSAIDFAFVASGLGLYAAILPPYVNGMPVAPDFIAGLTYPRGGLVQSFNVQDYSDVAVWPPLVPCPSYP